MRAMSRQESQRQTRAALIDSAEREFRDCGFTAASLERIAARAGFTRGAIYKNFADKYELFYAVLTQWISHETSTIAYDLAAAPDGTPQLDVLAAWFDDRLVPQSLAVAYNEFNALAASRPQARDLLARHQQTVRERVAAMIDQYLERASVVVPMSSEHFAAVIAALSTGLAHQRELSPSAVPAQLYTQALTYLWNGMQQDVNDRADIAPQSARPQSRRRNR